MGRSRRDRGTGSISHRMDGTWTARLTIGVSENGSQKVKAFYGKTENEVKRKLREFQTELIKNDGATVQKSTVGAFLNSWLEETKVNELKPKSYDRLEQTVKYQIAPYIGYLQIASVTSDDVQSLLNTLRKKGLSYSTVKKAYNALTDCFSNAVERRKVSQNPTIGVSMPRRELFEQSDIHYYTRDEARAICDTATALHKNGTKKYRLGDCVVVLFNTGIRTAELAGLKWSDVDFKSRQIRIENTRVVVKDRNGGDKSYKTITQNSTKSKSGQRTICLNENAYCALERLRAEERGAEFVFSNQNGEPMTIRYLDRTLRKIVKAAGLPDEKQYGPHALRHTFASFLFDNGVDVKTVSEILGHSDVETTYRTYIHLLNKSNKMSKAVHSIENIF